MKDTKNKKFILLVSVTGIIFILSVIYVINFFFGTHEGKTAVISQNGKILYEIELDKVKEPYTIRIDGLTEGSYNLIEVRNGEIAVTEASCPDKVCVNMGFIHDSSIPVTCLPNKLIIKITGGNSKNDVVVY